MLFILIFWGLIVFPATNRESFKGVETPLITVQLHELETFTSTDCNNCFEKAASFVKKVHIYVVLKPLSHARGVIIERQYICMRAERFSDDSCEFSRLMESFTELMGAVENNHSFDGLIPTNRAEDDNTYCTATSDE